MSQTFAMSPDTVSVLDDATVHLVEYSQLLNKLENDDKETHNHGVRIGQYAKLIAQAVGLPARRQELLLLAVPLHDIGKTTIPERILLKDGRLTPTEREIMMTHSRAGYDMLKSSESPLLRVAAQIALAHHEKFDGSGYPNNLVGDSIPLSARICALADVFDALLSEGPHKPAWQLPAAIDAIKRGRGGHFDPFLVDAFLEMMPEVSRVRAEFGDAVAA